VFRNVTMIGQENGCRIKTYSNEPGHVRNITWEKITMHQTAKCITVNAEYKPTPPGAKNFIEVSDVRLIDVEGDGCKIDAEFICPSQAPCKDVYLNDVHVAGGSNMKCSNAYGKAVDSITSCLKGSGPSPAPTPSPGPSPSGCDVDGCLARCESKYGGKIADQGDAYMCGKGCAGLKGGAVEDRTKLCKYDQSERQAKCKKQCSGASSSSQKVAECEYGCDFWETSEEALLV